MATPHERPDLRGIEGRLSPRPAGAPGYSVAEVSNFVGLSVPQIRSYVRGGFLDPGRGPRGELRLSFGDLALLRTARELLAARIPARRVQAVLRRLKEQLPDDRRMTGVRIDAVGKRVVARDGAHAWEPESGQVLVDFDALEPPREVAHLTPQAAEDLPEEAVEAGAQDWYELGCQLELQALGEAQRAYHKALEIDPRHVDAHLNLGRLRHENGDLAAALGHYRRALEASPEDATAAFNLGVVLEDLGQARGALEAYERVMESEPRYADAYYNAACLYESLGDKMKALRLLKRYRQLVRQER